MNASNAKLAFPARVASVVAVHGLLLAWLAPASLAQLPQLAWLWLLGITLAASALAFWLARPLRDDALVVSQLLPGPSSMPPPPGTIAHSEELQGAIDALHTLHARALELKAADRAARSAIDEAEQLRASFVASMGHDLRGQLNSIVGFADLLVMEGHGVVTTQQRPSVELIRHAAQDLLALLEHMLAWARFQAEPVAPDVKPIALSDLVADAVREAERRSAGRGLRVMVRELPAVQVSVDRAQLIAALLGLMDTSIRAAKPVTIELRAAFASAVGSVEGLTNTSPEIEGEHLLLEVRDRDLLVRDVDHEGFFEAFRPSFAPSGQRIAGLGLGPALARTLIRAHGGNVWLSSRVGYGTSFKMTLPIAP